MAELYEDKKMKSCCWYENFVLVGLVMSYWADWSCSGGYLVAWDWLREGYSFYYYFLLASSQGFVGHVNHWCGFLQLMRCPIVF